MDASTLTFVSLFGELLLVAIGFLLWNKIQGTEHKVSEHETRITNNTQNIALNSQKDDLLMTMVEKELSAIRDALGEIKERLTSLEELEKKHQRK